MWGKHTETYSSVHLQHGTQRYNLLTVWPFWHSAPDIRHFKERNKTQSHRSLKSEENLIHVCIGLNLLFLAKIGENHSSSLKRSSLPGWRGWQTRHVLCWCLEHLFLAAFHSCLHLSIAPSVKRVIHFSPSATTFFFQNRRSQRKTRDDHLRSLFFGCADKYVSRPHNLYNMLTETQQCQLCFFAFYLWQIRINKNPSSIKNQQFWNLTVIAQK